MEMSEAAWNSRRFWRFRPVRTATTWEVFCDEDDTALPFISSVVDHLKVFHALDVNFAPTIEQKNNGTHAIDREDDVTLANAAGGNVLLNLPAIAKRPLIFIRIDTTRANTVTIGPDAAGLIDGETTLLLEPEESVLIMPSGANWLIAASHLPNVHTRTLTGTTTLGRTDNTLWCDASGGSFTVTLPPVATALLGKEYTIKKTVGTAAQKITITGDGAETIDGSATIVLLIVDDSIMIRNEGTEWKVV